MSQSADPQVAVRRLETFCARYPSEFQQIAYSPFGLQALVAVFSASDFLSEELLQHPVWLLGLLHAGWLHRGRTREEIDAELADWLLSGSLPSPALRMAEFRRKQILRILLRDVLGFGALPEITEELSNLADALLDAAYSRIRLELAQKYGSPRLADGSECGYSILALGKLGGRELNYSSDIDLMFVYEGPGNTDGAQAISNQEFFKKISNQLTDLMGTYTAEGMIYRVDLRLRPDGRLGEVCLSMDAAKNYYDTRARDWELQMLIKARTAAGDKEPGRQLLEWVQPKIYSTTLDFSHIEAMSETRERLNEKLSSRRRATGIDVKLARGGIRDIEFLVQCLQRLHGGRETWIRNSSTLLALVRLRDKDLLSDSEYSRLASAYQYLRHLEHRLQFAADRQTHLLPEKLEEQALVARRMPPGLLGGQTTPEALLMTLNAHLEHVQEIYERVIHAQQTMYYTHTPAQPPPGGLNVESLPEPNGPDAAPSSNLIRFLDQKAPGFAGSVARARLGRSLTAFEHFLERVIKRDDWLEALNGDAVLSGYLLDLFAHSPYFAEQLMRQPEYFEEIRTMRLRGRSTSAFAEIMPLLEDAVEMRRFFLRQMFRLQVESICLQVPIFETLERTSALADAAIASVYRLAVAQAFSANPPATAGYEPGSQMMVIALGRLGMQEFDLASDADLLFVIPDADLPELHFWTRVAEKIVTILSSYTGDGTMFAVDTRLCPNGKGGALVQSESTYHEYFAKTAEAWEGVAYMKTRAVAGDVERATSFLADLQKVDWRRYGQSGRSKQQLRHMRMRIEKELSEDNPLKTAVGGYYDIDFSLMYLRLRGAGLFFKVLNTPARIEVLEQMGHLDPNDAHFLKNAATFYRAVDHGLRLISGHTEGSLPNSEWQLQMLTKLVRRWVPEHLCDQPLGLELLQIQGRTREYFERLFGEGRS
ncbi:[protein-PII] uridylyltransferase family protein [Paludibaculum fermentans]|uniref:Glutamine-synthetase adenylyltransferase n=1 Tax=Paludibaculum fermentans TaxID=1473598 RepID=A0A7S7NNI2_PALFE|nr:glutamine-synthetase adenylyltransferase [Paludibaculum fermentans]QOY86805.1 glutamine-synthetase adenylyltransferase [Paludibaculum fermentans]